jgi:RNA polymerase sigma-70 factor (ECF subfamily)
MAESHSHGLSPEAERDYVDRARQGDQEALGLLYDAYLPRLYRYCLSRVSSETDAEDLAEEIFLKVLGAIDGFEWHSVGPDQRVPFAAWLFRIAHNHVVSFHRRAATRGPAAELSEAIRDERRGPAELAETKIAIEEVFAAVRALPEAQRDVILLRFASGLSVAETAAVLGNQQTNVKVLQHKGIQRLKRILVTEVEQRLVRDEPARPWSEWRS